MEDTKMTFDKVKKLLSEQLDVDEEKITMDSSISEDLGADSLDVVELLMSIEDNFGVVVPDEEAANLKTVGDVVKFIDANS
jgi:acyl carrier protein